MPLKYDIDNIFCDLEKQVRRKKEQLNQINENEPIKSPEDAPKTQEVAPAFSKISEDTHGGDEASKEIKDSPNSANDGENSDKENKSTKTEKSGNQDVDKRDSEDIEDHKKKNDTSDAKNKKDTKDSTGNKDGKSSDKERKSDSVKNENGDKKQLKASKEELQKSIEALFEEKHRKLEEFRTQNRQEYLKKYILEIIKKIAAQHAGIDKQDGSETYDKKQMLQHMLKHQGYKLLGDKYDLRDARYVQFFIDTSGVYGCGSNKLMGELMPEIIQLLEKQGYECYIAACGNGFYGEDMVEDYYYHTRETLEEYRAGKVSNIACPTEKTAAKMANEAEFSIILADFDGLSSICRMANLCQKDKVPYFLSTEDRYPWEDPTYHDWVDPDMCEYDPKLVYDVSMDGNPTLEEYKRCEGYYYEYDEDDGYDEYEQDDDDYEYEY